MIVGFAHPNTWTNGGTVKQTQSKFQPVFVSAVFSTMLILVLVFAHFGNLSSRVFAEADHVSLDLCANRTSTPQKPGAETNVSSVTFGKNPDKTKNETSYLNSSMENAHYYVDAKNCSLTDGINPEVATGNSTSNGNSYVKLFNFEPNQNQTSVHPGFNRLRIESGQSKSNLSSENSTISTFDVVADDTKHASLGLNPRKLESISNKGNPERLSQLKRLQLDSSKFISEEKRHSILNHRTIGNVGNVQPERSFIVKPSKDNLFPVRPITMPIPNESTIFSGSNTSARNVTSISSMNTTEAKEKILPKSNSLHNSPIGKRVMANSSSEMNQTTPRPVNASALTQQPSEDGEDGSGVSILDVITSPFVKNALKYIVTEFYPKSILDRVAKRRVSSNSTRNGSQAQEVNLNPSVAYPLIMEGVSILVNRLTDDGSGREDPNDSNSVVKGQIVQGVIESLNKILKPKGEESQQAPSEKPIHPTVITEYLKVGGLNKDVLDSRTLNQLLPLVEKVPRENLQNSINGLLGIIASNSTSFEQIPDKSGVDLAKILRQPEILSVMLKNGPKFSGSHNTTGLAEILKNPNFLNSGLGSRSNLTDSGNLTNIMDEFLPKNGGSEGISPKNPLMRSDFASKVLAKSPIAHLGALDENVKRLITNSLEKAVSRVKVNDKGEVQIPEGMKKMLGKMIDSDGPSGVNRTSDSLMDVLKSGLASGSIKVEPSIQLGESRPIGKRNVTRHSPLHRKFQEKYGKFYQKSSVEPLKCSHFAFIVFPIVITVFSA